MIVDNAPAISLVHWTNGGGDAGRRRVEHRSILKLSVLITIPLRFGSDLHYEELYQGVSQVTNVETEIPRFDLFADSDLLISSNNCRGSIESHA